MDASSARDVLSDDELMKLAQAGGAEGEEAFSHIVRRHQAGVRRFAHRYVGDAALARDVAQEVFIALWVSRASYEPREKLRALLMEMTWRRSRATMRGRRRQEVEVAPAETNGELQAAHVGLPGSSEGQAATEPGDRALQRLLRDERLRGARSRLLTLVPEQRQVAILRFVHGYSLRQIAELTGRALGTVKSQLFRATEKLRRDLGEDVL